MSGPASARVHDVVVVGGGLVGAALACVLARGGLSVAVVEARAPPAFDPASPIGLRVSALSPGSIRVLDAAGAWKLVRRQRHCDYRAMRVEDRDGATAVEFSAVEFGLETLGTLVENDIVVEALWQCLDLLPGVQRHCPAKVTGLESLRDCPGVRLDDGTLVRGQVLVGADGADSLVRQALGVGCQTWDYGQRGLVAVVETEQPNDGVAWQRFLPGGPLAFLPMPGGVSSIVWSCPDSEARRLLELGDAAFRAELECATANDAGLPFGPVLGCGPRAAFPLHLQLAESYSSGWCALVGDAAHVVHPLAGQGVNIGLMDAAALAESLLAARRSGADFRSARLLDGYARARRSEAELMARGIHGLKALFTPAALGPLRALGLGLVNRSWYAKEAFVRRAAGLDRHAPALARGTELAELMR